MANSNVRFYKLEVLPNFDVSKQGIFVHVTKTMYKDGSIENPNPKEPAKLWMTPGKVGDAERMNLVQWLEKRRIESIASGLWFGGENGWELLSNDTNEINAAIAALDVPGYAQATMDTHVVVGDKTDSKLTILGIQEVDGIIGNAGDAKKLDIAIDGVYNELTNKIATVSTVTTAIEALDVNTAVQAVTKTTETNGNTTLTFNGVKEENGIISQGTSAGASTFIVGDAKLNIEIGTDSFEVFSANAKENKSIYLDKNVFKKNVVEGKNVLSIYTTEGVSSSNPLVTQNDINGLVGAMHYRGGVTSLPTADENTKKGDVWIVTEAFGEYEAGDMFIARADGASATFDKVQGNLTLGIGNGQIAANVGALADGNLVVGVNSETGKGIKTVEFDVTNLTGTTGKNERKLTYDNGTPDTSDATLFHSATIKDTFKVIGKDFTETINISSTNRSIKIARNAGDNDSTGVVVDLVWNTIMEP